MTNDPLADAHRAIGAFFCAFSRVEHQLGESVKAVYGLQNNDASDAIVAALGDVARKASLVWAASKGAKNPDGSEASAEWKAKVEATIERVFNCNQHDRVPLAHSLLQPNADGSVDLVRLKIDKGEVRGKNGVQWSKGAFKEKTQRLNNLADELELLNRELRTFKYVIIGAGMRFAANGFETPGALSGAGMGFGAANVEHVQPSAPDDDKC